MYSVKEKYHHKLHDNYIVQLQYYTKVHTASLKRRIILGEKLKEWIRRTKQMRKTVQVYKCNRSRGTHVRTHNVIKFSFFDHV